MKKIENFENIDAQSGVFNKLEAGAYVCRITRVENVEMNPMTGKGDYLIIEYDVASGGKKDFFYNKKLRVGFSDGKFIRSYKESAVEIFKHFINCVEKSNQGFLFDFDETKLVGKLVGLNICEEEYEKRDGSIGTRYTVKQVLTINDVIAGNWKPFQTVKLSAKTKHDAADTTSKDASSDNDDDALPF